jgi:ABC-type lipoprotein release transport system permease subunit
VVGAVFGLLAAVALTRLLKGILFGVQPLDPLSLTVAVAVLMTATLLAGSLPAWRASRLDPAAVLRQ